VSLAWFHCTAGASGDMVLGALVDAGAALENVQRAVDALGVDPVLLSSEQVTRHGIGATKINVKVARSTVVRTWGNIRRILEEAELPDRVRGRALDVFARLARAEAAAHRTTPDAVHFHEVGALDALAHVVGACTALEELDVSAATGSRVALGSGMTRGEHGLVPVPSPTVLSLLGEAGAPVYSGDAPYELCTPTGAALLVATCSAWGGLPPMRVTATGFGAGTRDLDEVPNVLRVVLGEPAPSGGPGAGEPALVLDANVDDLDPRLWPPVLARLLNAGAADAWLTPILTKDGRPAHTLSVLLPAEAAAAVHRVIFTETSTTGVHQTRVDRRVLARETRTVTVDGYQIRVKAALLDGVVVSAEPEYEDVVGAAERLGRPVKAVLAAANAAVHVSGLAP
jgi:uncharacterized protein (TIGR00299 family) protein